MIRIKSTIPISPERSQKRPKRKPTNFVRSTPQVGSRARGRRGESLASARDRQRLRERNLAERERVERMAASVPVPVERRTVAREPTHTESTPSSRASSPAQSRRFALRAIQPEGCPVCGDDRIVTDEVIHGGTLRMSECLHCEHRWTRRPKGHWIELGNRMNRVARRSALPA